MRTRAPIFRHGVVSLTFVLFTLLLNRPQVILTPHLGSTLWYPTAGLGMALMLGLSPWYGLLMWVCCATTDPALYHERLTSYNEIFGEAGMTLCYVAAASILRSFVEIDTNLRRRRDVLLYIGISLTGAVASTMIGVGCLTLDRVFAWRDFPVAAFNWFVSDAVGLLGVCPFLLVIVLPMVRKWVSAEPGPAKTDALPRGKTTVASLAEMTAQLAVMAASLWLMFSNTWGFLPHFYLSFIPISWMALRNGVRRIAIGTLFFNSGIVLSLHWFHPTFDILEKAAFFMVICSATGLMVASEVNEREHTAQALGTKTDYLNALIQNCPLGIVVLNREGKVELANAAFEKMFLYDQRELAAVEIDRLLSPDPDLPSAQVVPLVFAGQAINRIGQRKRKDGRILDVETHAVRLLVNGQVQGAYKIFQDVSSRMLAAEAERKHAEGLRGLVQELQRRTVEMAQLNDMRDWLECCGSEKEACGVVKESVRRLFPEAVGGTLFLFESSRKVFEAAVHWGPKGDSQTSFASEACWAVRRGQPHWTAGFTAGVKCNHLAEEISSAACLCVALLAQGNMLGVLHLEFGAVAEGRPEAENDNPQDAQTRLAISVAGHIAQSLASLRLREALRDQSIRDPLTGLFNRRFLEESLGQQLHRADRRQEPVSLLFIDLDHFKRFNDTFGHEAGDLVLRAISDLFQTFFRAGDLCCRYGGEEFAIILPGADSNVAAARANELREQAKRLSLEHNDRPLGAITLSIGVAAFPEHGSSVRELFAIADHSLYQSKASGRDAVTVGRAGVMPPRDLLAGSSSAIDDSLAAH
jgi:diguanylate cyclase (GGDEF)-like protein/PAS domain S-box-containing protein